MQIWTMHHSARYGPIREDGKPVCLISLIPSPFPRPANHLGILWYNYSAGWKLGDFSALEPHSIFAVEKVSPSDAIARMCFYTSSR